MARLTKKQLAALEEERQSFNRVAALAAQKGYSLHRMMGVHPYGLLTPDQRRGFEGTLEAIEAWLMIEGTR
jgi:hypothetical protein